MGRWSITSILTILYKYFFFWIRDYNTVINQRIFFIGIKITKNEHVSITKKKERKKLEKWKKMKKE